MATKPHHLQERLEPPKTVLIVHTDKKARDLACRILAKRHFRVQTCESGADAVQQIYQLNPDLIILDTGIEDINGYQLCRLIKHDPLLRKIPLILLMGNSCQQKLVYRFSGYKNGADAILLLEELPMKLLKQVDSLLEVYQGVKRVKAQSGTYPQLINLLDKALLETTLMCEIRGLSELVADTSQLNYMLFSLLENVLSYDVAAIFYNDDLKGARQVTFNLQSMGAPALEELKIRFFEALLPVCPALDLQDTAYEVIGETSQNESADLPSYTGVWVKSFFENDTFMGAVAFYATEEIDYANTFPVSILERELYVLMRLRHLYTKAESRSMIDAVTGVYNSRYFMSSLERELTRAKRYDMDLSLLLIEIPAISDLIVQWESKFSRSESLDNLMTQLSKLIQKIHRSSDIVAILENHQFGVILPETSAQNAAKISGRIESAISSQEFLIDDETIQLTVNIGLSGYEPDQDDAFNSVSQLLARVQQAIINSAR